jgi:hypothetical protein
MTEKKETKTEAKVTKAAAAAHEAAMAPKERDPLNQAVKEKSEEVAMTQDEIRRTRHGGPLASRREELAGMQPDFAALDKGK